MKLGFTRNLDRVRGERATIFGVFLLCVAALFFLPLLFLALHAGGLTATHAGASLCTSPLAGVAASPMLREYAQGAAQSMMQPVADFLAPTVNVATSVGRFKRYDEKNRFRIPDTRRAIGGRATELSFDASDATYNCEPHALDYPVDMLEQMESAQLENVLMEGATACAEVAALAHEKAVIDAALTAAGAGTDSNFTSASVDPVDILDTQILNVVKASKSGSAMNIRLLFGPLAWQRFKNNALVRARVFMGQKNPATSVTDEQVAPLLIGQPEVRTSFMVYDTTKEGLDPSMSFLLDNAILIFAASSNPTRRDPSFMKTFRLMGQWMVPGTYLRDDGRVEVAKFDWSEDVQVTNSTAVARINATNS